MRLGLYCLTLSIAAANACTRETLCHYRGLFCRPLVDERCGACVRRGEEWSDDAKKDWIRFMRSKSREDGEAWQSDDWESSDDIDWDDISLFVCDDLSVEGECTDEAFVCTTQQQPVPSPSTVPSSTTVPQPSPVLSNDINQAKSEATEEKQSSPLATLLVCAGALVVMSVVFIVVRLQSPKASTLYVAQSDTKSIGV